MGITKGKKKKQDARRQKWEAALYRDMSIQPGPCRMRTSKSIRVVDFHLLVLLYVASPSIQSFQSRPSQQKCLRNIYEKTVLILSFLLLYCSCLLKILVVISTHECLSIIHYAEL